MLYPLEIFVSPKHFLKVAISEKWHFSCFYTKYPSKSYDNILRLRHELSTLIHDYYFLFYKIKRFRKGKKN